MRFVIAAILLCSAVQAQAPAVPTIWVVGDSTASNQNRRGWADPFGWYFDPAAVKVVNRARAGRSSRTFITEGLWEKVRAELKPGDWVLIQFGHNDGGPPDKDRARGSLPGLGEESREFTLPNGSTETVYTFGHYLQRMVADTTAAGAHPVLLSLTVRNIWKDGKVERGSGQFSSWSAEAAKAAGIPFLDVMNAIADQYDRLGGAKVKAWFPEDHTHTSPEGAVFNAQMVVAAVKSGTPELAAFLFPPSDLRLPMPRDASLPNLLLIGDSTVRNGRGDGANGQWGWGDPLWDRFDTAKVNVVNRAVGGLSSRTFLTQGHWDRALAFLKPGDVVLMQFGHNDNGPLDDTARARGTLKGVGEETREIDNPITKQHEVVHTYGWYLSRFIADAKAKGAIPIVCSLVPHKIWKEGRIERNHDTYAGWAEEVARREHVSFIDLNEEIAKRYDALGQEKVDPLFGDEHTHTSRAGAEINADIVVEQLKTLRLNPTAAWIR
jgi:lysophospholipase L1-like esterase